MSRDDIIKLALEAGGRMYSSDEVDFFLADLERFATLVAAAEREECAKVALSIDDQESVNQRSMQKRIVRAIRARGQA